MTIPQPGMQIKGRYSLVRPLGSGMLAEVFAGRDRETNTKVTIKLLHEPLCLVEESVLRFARECAVTQKIDHPNTAKVLDFGREDEGPLKGRHFLIMEMVGGESLEKRMEKGPIPPDQVVPIVTQIASALQAAHAQGVVHRDVAPNNIVLVRKRGESERVKVLDFGLARLQHDAGDELTDVGVRLGTALYMAPEYIERSELDHRSDIYSLGALLFHLLTGDPPYVGSSMRVMQDHVGSAIPRPGDKVPGIPSWLEELIIRMLAKDPTERPQSAQEIVDLLKAKEAGLSATAQEERRAIHMAQTNQQPEQQVPASSVLHAGGSNEKPVYTDDPSIPTKPKMPMAYVAVMGVVGIIIVMVVAVITALVLASVFSG